MINRTNAVYIENEINLSWPIKPDSIYDEK